MNVMVSVAFVAVSVLAAGATCAQSEAHCSAVTATTDVNRKLDEVQRLRKALRFTEARRDIEGLVAAHPQMFRVLYISALVDADQQKWPEAESELKSAITLQGACLATPGFVPDYTVYNTLGWVQMAQGHGADAESNYHLALAHSKQLSPSSIARIYANLGYLYFTQGNLRGARPLLQMAAIGGNATAVNTLNTMDKAEAIYQSQAHQAVDQPFRVYYVIAMTSDSREDLERAVQKVQTQLGAAKFNEQFPKVQVYRPNGDYQYTLLVSSTPLSYSAAVQLKATAINAGFAPDTWLWGADEDYFSPKK